SSPNRCQPTELLSQVTPPIAAPWAPAHKIAATAGKISPLGSANTTGLLPQYLYKLLASPQNPIGSGWRKRPRSGEEKRLRRSYRPSSGYHCCPVKRWRAPNALAESWLLFAS